MIKSPLRIAMWSGPRNLSTAMMRCFGARSDTICIDEPFYAPYLKETGLEHPMRSDILNVHEADAHRVAEALSVGPALAPVIYQKHMTHHMVDAIPRDWMARVRHVFLIRHPARVMASYSQKMDTLSLEDIGIPQQDKLFNQVYQLTGEAPLVLDSDDILAAPEPMIETLCGALGLDFQPKMLTWPAGARPEDGIWAAHWYDKVVTSTGFGGKLSPLPEIDTAWQALFSDAMDHYRRMEKHCLKIV